MAGFIIRGSIFTMPVIIALQRRHPAGLCTASGILFFGNLFFII
jgi:hypothetical protein